MMIEAAQKSVLPMMRHAYMSAVIKGVTSCYTAAYNGHLESLKYVHEHGCPWDEETS